MEISGCYAYRWRQRYLIVHNQLDSDPLVLGRKLVNRIPKDRDAFRKWRTQHQEWLNTSYREYMGLPKVEDPKLEVAGSSISGTSIERQDLDGVWCDFPPRRSMFVKWTYTIDLDRDVFTLDALANFRLSDIPEDWADFIHEDEHGHRSLNMERCLVHLVPNILAHPPTTQSHFLQVYHENCPELMPSPQLVQSHVENILLRVQEDLVTSLAFPYVQITSMSDQWTPQDIQMKNFAYLLIKLSTWEALRFDQCRLESDHFSVMGKSASRFFTHGHPFLPETDFFVPVMDGQVFISLATHLDNVSVLKMAVAKAITKIIDSTTTTACIVSLKHVVIVQIDRTQSGNHIKHTEPLELFPNFDHSQGRKALIAVLSPEKNLTKKCITDRMTNHSKNGVFPVEVYERIFYCLAITPGGYTTLPDFGRTCHLFASIFQDRVLHISSDRTILNYPTWLPDCAYGLDEDGWLSLYNLGKIKHPHLLSDMRRVREYNPVFVTPSIGRIYLGLGKLRLIPIDEGEVHRTRARSTNFRNHLMSYSFRASGVSAEASNRQGFSTTVCFKR